jgi:hypothetical protein
MRSSLTTGEDVSSTEEVKLTNGDDGIAADEFELAAGAGVVVRRIDGFTGVHVELCRSRLLLVRREPRRRAAGK